MTIKEENDDSDDERNDTKDEQPENDEEEDDDDEAGEVGQIVCSRGLLILPLIHVFFSCTANNAFLG